MGGTCEVRVRGLPFGGSHKLFGTPDSSGPIPVMMVAADDTNVISHRAISYNYYIIPQFGTLAEGIWSLAIVV